MKTTDRIFQKGMALGLHVIKMKQPVKIEGEHALQRISQILAYENCSRPLIVTGPRVSKTDFFQSLLASLNEVEVFDEVQPDPNIQLIEKMVMVYKEKECDCFIGIGGGSNLDAMKACAARIACPNKSIPQMKGTMKIRTSLPLMIAVPTTAGTGSECTIAAVITDGNHKYSLNDPVLCPDYAILDPWTTVTMPASVTANTGMDALTHAVEAYLNTPYHQKNTAMYCENAVRLIFDNLLKAYRNPQDIEAREHMLDASYQAGLAFTVACVGNVHALAHTVGGLYHVPHGLANAILLPIVLEAYGSRIEKELAHLARVIGMEEADDAICTQLFIQRIRYLNQSMGIPSTFTCIEKKDLDTMASWADQEANPLYPVPVIFTQKDFKNVLSKAGKL